MTKPHLGSIDLARRQCAEIVGTFEEDPDGKQYGSVDVAEILSGEVGRLWLQLERVEAAILAAPHHRECKALYSKDAPSWMRADGRCSCWKAHALDAAQLRPGEKGQEA